MARSYPSTAYKTCLLFCAAFILLFPVGIGAQEKGGSGAPAGLPEELEGMAISDTFIPLFAEAIGTIQAVRGRLVVRHGDTMRAYYAAAGNQLYEKDILYTLDESRSRLKFVTDEIITMGANSHLRVDQVLDNRQAQEKQSVFSMMKGKAMIYALRLFRYKKVTVDVRTPTAIAGIRGTKFGIEVVKIETRQASAGPIYLADASGSLPSGLLTQNSSGGGYQTTVYGYDGEVEVTATGDGSIQTLGPGENIVVGEEGGGEVTPTDPNQSQQFAEDTDAPDEGDGGGEGSGEGGSGGTQSGEGGGAGDEEPAIDTVALDAETGVSDFSQNQTTEDIQDQAAQTVVSGKHVGYFSALLTLEYEGLEVADVYANSTRADIEADEISGNSILDPAGFITAAGTGADSEQSYVKRIKATGSWGAWWESLWGPLDTGDLGMSAPMDDLGEADRLGTNAYMEWGIWKMTIWVRDASGSGPDFAVTDHAFYVGGEVTPDVAVPGISGYYEGPAYGTFFNGAGGVPMIGDFYAEVDGLSKTVPIFSLVVSSQSEDYAQIVGSGAFVGNSSEFKINDATFNLNGSSAEYGACHGSLYGPNGEHIGGAWAMKAGNEAAVGIFAGDKIVNGLTP